MDSKVTVTSLMIDVNGHYVFSSGNWFELYGLAGFDILLAWRNNSFKIMGANPSEHTIKESDNAMGLNLGVGSSIRLTESIDLTLEAKYLVSRYDQFMINAGVLFGF